MCIDKVADNDFADKLDLMCVDPMPDEYFSGYAGRILNVHGAYQLEDLCRRPPVIVSVDYWQRYLQLLSQCASQKPSIFVAQHTSLLVNSTLIADRPDSEVPIKEWNASHFRRLIAAVPSLRCCTVCVSEDLHFWGFSYWRMSHQIAGVNWCPKHSVRLINSDLGASQLCHTDLPQDIVAVRGHTRADPPNYPRKIANRYADIAFGLVEAREQFTHRQLVDCLNNQAMSRRIRCALSLHGTGSMTSALRDESFHELDWAESLMPRRGTTYCGDLEIWLQSVFNRRRLVEYEAYVLAMAILFPCADHAIKKLIDTRGIEFSNLDATN